MQPRNATPDSVSDEPGPRTVETIATAVKTLEGGGFPVRRPFPTAACAAVDPFLLLDHLGPVSWGPGEAIGAPDHPHRGFETVTYLLTGQMRHKDSQGHQGNLGPGDVQWMTAGAGVVHSELPAAEFQRTGGVMHGLQIWVNLPARAKMIPPRYQEIPAAQIPQAATPDGRVTVRIIAGEALGQSAVIDTHTPIIYLHYTLQPGGRAVQAIPRDHNALVYVIAGSVALGPEATVAHEGQMAMLGAGDTINLATAANANGATDLIVLAGVPLREPVARYGPFVMNTEAEIQQAIRDYRQGRMGRIQT